MVSFLRRFTCVHRLGILFMRVLYVTFVAPIMVLSRLLELDFNILLLWSQLLIFLLVIMIWLSLFMCHLMVGHLSFFMWMM
jgi:hypothetical protein